MGIIVVPISLRCHEGLNACHVICAIEEYAVIIIVMKQIRKNISNISTHDFLATIGQDKFPFKLNLLW